MVNTFVPSIVLISIIFILGIFTRAHSPAHGACRCCDSDPEVLSLESGIESGVCGVMRNFRCEGGDPLFTSHACVNSGDCDLGPCLITPPSCQEDLSITCSQDSDCAGTCVEQTTQGFPVGLECGRLYTGGGLNSVPLPLRLPDMQQHFLRVEECPHREWIELGPTTRASVGELHCTEGRKCSADSDQPGDACVVHGDCPNGTCEDPCLFGSLLPIPNAVTIPTSTCIIRTVAEDVSGTAWCEGGAVDVDIPLRWAIHVTGDLLTRNQPPDVPGLQSCPLCTKVCVGGGNEGYPCLDDSECDSNSCSESERCVGRGPRENLPCTPDTSRLDVHTCCSGGVNDAQRCGNGVSGPDETCDDGNTIGGDGCSPACQIEACFTCAGEPSTCTRSTACVNGDGCCPPGCGSTDDDDCPRAVKCTYAKAKAAGKKAAGLLKAFAKNEKAPNVTKLAQEVSKAQSRFSKRYDREDAKGGCQTLDDAQTIEAKLDAFVSDVLSEICLP